MRKALYVLMVIPAFAAGSLILFEITALSAILLFTAHRGGLGSLFHDVLAVIIGGGLGIACIMAGRYAKQRKIAAIGCLLIAIVLVFGGFYLAYDLSHNPQPPSMRGEEGWGIVVVAIPAIFFGFIGLVGSIGHSLFPLAEDGDQL